MREQNEGHPTLVLRMRKVEKKQSDRSQSRLLLSLLPADTLTNTMRLWESLKSMLYEKHQRLLVLDLILVMYRVLHTGVMVVHHFKSA